MNFKIGGKHARSKELIEKILETRPEHIEAHAKQQKLIHNAREVVLNNWLRNKQGHHKLEQENLEVAQKQYTG